MELDFLKQFDFFSGVPDSQLRPLCDYLMDTYGISDRHIIAANEGNAVALAAGYHLATGKVPVVYMQNSGIGNVINPVASLLHGKVYSIPCLFLIGWRGEPGLHDEPQHIFQGEVTLKLLEDMQIPAFVIGKDTTQEQVCRQLAQWQPLLEEGRQVALVVRKGALTYDKKAAYRNDHSLTREQIIARVTEAAGDAPIISTTGKASRELFEIRQARGQDHRQDFLTVGSMGHSSSIALQVALEKPHRKVWCIDGDGAMLMHLGAMALIGTRAPRNLVHIVINNASHETVGGMPTVADRLDIPALAKACGYPHAVTVADAEALDAALTQARQRDALTLIEVKCAIGARPDLGRPTTSARDNKEAFMAYLQD